MVERGISGGRFVSIAEGRQVPSRGEFVRMAGRPSERHDRRLQAGLELGLGTWDLRLENAGRPEHFLVLYHYSSTIGEP